ncbi:Tubulin-specific chaperone C, N-terminal,Tubulin binding cofactor C-like domain,C-CAP/cofactor C-like [Cinara cedri]|uniref:Tubulin-specific chaperone C, N-terminal,Tubulin binding cofactor C-like domain,C-CAP/cofactor C-like n=1 Tax=Cinara cedri TaxID=506608 RepID=A0A5E4MZ86_9HEMI|nr:Tubulin-specific chaperone C, N-terminal,Tubulin binding cofactor C-like domain,C-CAP/cofactor C-like [Cinara cedri]
MNPKSGDESIDQKSLFDLSYKTKIKEINDMFINIEKKCIEIKDFQEILNKINELQEFVNDSKTFLPAYNMKKCSTEIKDITKCYEQMHEKLLPKKKFSFGKRPVKLVVKAKVEDQFEPINESKVYKEDCGFRNRSNENLKLTEEETLSKDIALDALSNCNVFICGTPSTVRVSSLSTCKIFACVSTSIFVENCKDTIFVCASQQLRIHDTVATDFYIYVTSSAIIENCKQLRFAPITLNSPLIEKSFELTGFDQSNNNWKVINDFDWLSSYESSPNWCEIPEEERNQPFKENNV